MLAGSGKYFGWAVGLFALSAIVFVFSLSTGRPHLRTPGAPAIEPVAIISAITGLASALAALITAIDKFWHQPKNSPEPTSGDGGRRGSDFLDDYPDYQTPRRAPPARRYRRGDIVKFIRPDSRSRRYNLIEMRRFIEYDEEGYEVWTVIDKYR